MQRKRIRQEELSALSSNPRVKSGLSLGVGSPLRTVVAISLCVQIRSRIFRLTNANATLVKRIQNIDEKSSMIDVKRRETLGITDMTMSKIKIVVRTTAARIESGIGAADTTVTQMVVAETLQRIAVATPRSE